MDTSLWEKIRSFDLDEPSSEYSFSTRLANENYWTINFTKKAIEEYKKFMYLAATSDFMVSPSEIIDTVWHQHLIFTKSYSDFCDLLGKRIEHIPSTHNKEDYHKFKLAKERTGKLYMSDFGAAPDQIWNYADMYEPLQLPKSKYKIRTIVIVGIFCFLALITPVYYLLNPVYKSIDNPYFMIGYILTFVLTFILLENYNRTQLSAIVTNWHQNSFIFDLAPMELIYLKTHKLPNIIHGRVNQLLQTGKISVEADNRIAFNNAYGISSKEDLIILEAIKTKGSIDYSILLKQLIFKAVFSNVPNSMNAFSKYFIKSEKFRKIFLLNFISLSFMLMLGFIRLLTGVFREKPVILIFICLVLSLIFTMMFLFRTTTLITKKIIPEFYANNSIPGINTENWDWKYFLLGNDVLSPVFIPMVTETRQDYGSNGPWGSSCGSSDSGGSCGSSCSSCGGCGGGGD